MFRRIEASAQTISKAQNGGLPGLPKWSLGPQLQTAWQTNQFSDFFLFEKISGCFWSKINHNHSFYH
jgi:hypothetical protein